MDGPHRGGCYEEVHEAKSCREQQRTSLLSKNTKRAGESRLFLFVVLPPVPSLKRQKFILIKLAAAISSLLEVVGIYALACLLLYV